MTFPAFETRPHPDTRWLPVQHQHGEVHPVGPACRNPEEARGFLLKVIADSLLAAQQQGEHLPWSVPFLHATLTGNAEEAWKIATNANPACPADYTTFDYTLELLEVDVRPMNDTFTISAPQIGKLGTLLLHLASRYRTEITPRALTDEDGVPEGTLLAKISGPGEDELMVLILTPEVPHMIALHAMVDCPEAFRQEITEAFREGAKTEMFGFFQGLAPTPTQEMPHVPHQP